MMAWLRRHKNPIFIGTLAIILIGSFVGLGGYLFTGADNAEAVAIVGGTKIPYMDFQNRVNQNLDYMRDQKKEVTDEVTRQVKMEVLREMIVNEILSQQAEKMGLKVTDLELAFSIRNMPRFQTSGQFNEALYFQYVHRALRTTIEEFERQQRAEMLSYKLKQLIFSSAKLMPADLSDDFLKAEYRKANKGSDKDFAKHRDELVENFRRSRAMDLINFYLRQLSSQIEIRNLLDQREQNG